jgi:hypothetical protein
MRRLAVAEADGAVTLSVGPAYTEHVMFTQESSADHGSLSHGDLVGHFVEISVEDPLKWRRPRSGACAGAPIRCATGEIESQYGEA